MPIPRRLLQVLTVAISAWYALWACAPAATLRPMTNMDVDGNEFGLVARAGVPQLGSPPDTCGGSALLPCNFGSGYGGEAWYMHRFSRWVSFGGTLFAGSQSLFGVGAQTRFHWIDTENVQFGTDVDVGFVYGAIGLPVAVRLVGGLWVFSAPSFGARQYQPLRVPLGVSWNITPHWGLSAEGAYGFDPVTPPVTLVTRSSISFALAGSYRF